MSLSSHDKSLKYLLSQEPADFIMFGLGTRAVRVVCLVEVDLPVRDRTTDGGYLIERESCPEVAHVEFYRRHQGLREVALDIGEAQVRLSRKEGVPVQSLWWDLYGSRRAPVLQRRILHLGPGKSGSRVVFVRVNLRGLEAQQLLTGELPTLWPLVPLTQDGAAAEPVRRAIEAIAARPGLRPGQRADHLAVLRFLAEVEGVPLKVLESYMSKEKMMESSLYQSIFKDGETKGMTEGFREGEVKRMAEDLIHLLAVRLGKFDPAVREIIRKQKDLELLNLWFGEAALALDTEAAQRLVHKIAAS